MKAFRLALAIAAILALAGLAAGAALDFAATVRAWLMGFVFVSLAPAGALVMILVGWLTRSPWRRDFRPQLTAMAGAAFGLWALGLPIALLLAWVYPWARTGAPAHLALYLSPGAFLARAVVTLAGWCALSVLAMRDKINDLLAGLGLLFQGVVLAVIPNDWALSVQPGWTTTDIGMTFLTLEVAVTAASILLLGPGQPQKDRNDLAGFLIAGVLGLIYMTFVAFLIDWYGDVPHRVSWWIPRVSGTRWIEVDAALACGLFTFLVLAFRRYRIAGAAALFGVALYCVWLVTPDLGALGWLVAPAAIVFQAAALALGASVLLERLTHSPARAHV